MATLSEANILAEVLMRQHGLPERGWRFDFDRARKRHGVCNFSKQRITLSRYYVENSDIKGVRLTLLHEIAHALVGHAHGHDRVWQEKCLAIGGDGKRCGQGRIPQTGGWRGRCGGGHEFHRCRKPKPMMYCVKCGPGLGDLTWRKCD